MVRMCVAVALLLGLAGTSWGQGGITITCNAGEPKVDAAGDFIANGTISVPANTFSQDPRTGNTTRTAYYVRSIKAESFDGANKRL